MIPVLSERHILSHAAAATFLNCLNEPSVNWLLHLAEDFGSTLTSFGLCTCTNTYILLSSHVSAPRRPGSSSSSSQSPAAPATKHADMKWSSVPCASLNCGCFINRVIALRSAGPRFRVKQSSTLCLNSNAQFSGGVGWAKLSLNYIQGIRGLQ